MEVIVTGGAGFIGSAVCRYLIASTDTVVTNVDKLTYAGNLQSLRSVADHPRYRFIQADICDTVLLEVLFQEVRPGAVMHLAAETHVDRSIAGARAFVETNILGTFTLLEAARRYWSRLGASEAARFRFLHVSTDEVHGSLGAPGRFDEASPYDPSSPYSASKAAADHLVSSWHRTYGFPAVISNCSNNYGPYHHPEKLIPLTILNAIEGRELPVYGDGGNVRDWLHVEDHARALHLVLTRGRMGQRYHIGSRDERANIEVVRTICAILDAMAPRALAHEQLIRFVADRPGHDRRYAVNPDKLEGELGWRAERNFDAGIEATVRWYLDNEWWWRPLRERGETAARTGGGEAGGRG